MPSIVCNSTFYLFWGKFIGAVYLLESLKLTKFLQILFKSESVVFYFVIHFHTTYFVE